MDAQHPLLDAVRPQWSRTAPSATTLGETSARSCGEPAPRARALESGRMRGKIVLEGFDRGRDIVTACRIPPRLRGGKNQAVICALNRH